MRGCPLILLSTRRERRGTERRDQAEARNASPSPTGHPMPYDPLFTLSGKIALVTGGSRGLGREMVLAFAERGADVIIASRKLAVCQALASEVEGRFGRQALALPANVSHWEECDALVEAAYEHFGRVDVLVNNAGLSPLYPTLDAVEEALFDKVIGVNLKGPFRLTALIGSRIAPPATAERS